MGLLSFRLTRICRPPLRTSRWEPKFRLLELPRKACRLGTVMSAKETAAEVQCITHQQPSQCFAGNSVGPYSVTGSIAANQTQTNAVHCGIGRSAQGTVGVAALRKQGGSAPCEVDQQYGRIGRPHPRRRGTDATTPRTPVLPGRATHVSLDRVGLQVRGKILECMGVFTMASPLRALVPKFA